jgi:hypothetical protein
MAGKVLAAVACLAAVATMLTGSAAAAHGTGTPVRVLQMNLCGSGIAHCFTGRSVPEAASVIRAQAPDVVTLNEICQSDVDSLRRAMDGTVVAAFRAAGDRRTGGPFRCRDGQPYGIGLLARGVAHGIDGGLYPVQDPGDPEERVWLCASLDGFTACTTHLANTSATVALGQCRYLLARVPRPAVLGGDLNLGSRDGRACVPAGYADVDDGEVQHVLATPGTTVVSSASIAMAGTTDHPALLATLTGIV